MHVKILFPLLYGDEAFQFNGRRFPDSFCCFPLYRIAKPDGFLALMNKRNFFSTPCFVSFSSFNTASWFAKAFANGYPVLFPRNITEHAMQFFPDCFYWYSCFSGRNRFIFMLNLLVCFIGWCALCFSSPLSVSFSPSVTCHRLTRWALKWFSAN